MSAVSGVMVIFLPFQRSSTVMSFSAVRMLSMKLAGTLVVSFGMKILIFLPLAALRIWFSLPARTDTPALPVFHRRKLPFLLILII